MRTVLLIILIGVAGCSRAASDLSAPAAPETLVAPTLLPTDRLLAAPASTAAPAGTALAARAADLKARADAL